MCGWCQSAMECAQALGLSGGDAEATLRSLVRDGFVERCPDTGQFRVVGGGVET